MKLSSFMYIYIIMLTCKAGRHLRCILYKYTPGKINDWNKKNKKKFFLQIAASDSKKDVKFKSDFFGTFSANVIFVPPEPIDFSAIFLNFGERLRVTPHALIMILLLLAVFVLGAVFLRRLDKRDALMVGISHIYDWISCWLCLCWGLYFWDIWTNVML